MARWLFPARMAAKYDVLSCAFRPALKCGRTLSSARYVGLPPLGLAESDVRDGPETSPFALLVESGVDALALGLALHAATAAAVITRAKLLRNCIIIVSVDR